MNKPYELQIDGRCRTTVNAPASLANFVVTPGALVETEWLVQNPRVSLKVFICEAFAHYQ